MILNKIDLYKEFNVEKRSTDECYLTCYVHENSSEVNVNRKYPCMLVIPGGGYGMVSFRESEAVAISYYAKGYNAFVLKYSCHPAKYPTQLIEASMAMAYIRRNAESMCNDVSHVAAVGFSAGGHLLGMISTMYNEKVINEVAGISPEEVKPNASVYSYAVCCTDYYQGTYDNLCDLNPEIMAKINISANVNKDTSPMFIWCTADDGVVDCGNSLALAFAARNNSVPFELHVYSSGPHGLSVCNKAVYPYEEKRCANAEEWFNNSLTWLKELGFDYVD